MTSETHEVIVIGGGAAGLAAAIACREQGIEDVLLIEREAHLGGILNQCIHDGFGLEIFDQSLTGPEYAQRYIDRLEELGIECLLDSMVIEMTRERCLIVVNRQGRRELQADAIILAMGCRERTRGALGIPGKRPSGIFTAGVAQNFINLQNIMPGERVVILGSGDIGMIMARRLTIEGSKVLMVVEKMPFCSGLPRNMNQCLFDFDIPLYLSHTVVDIHGKERLTGVTIAELDETGRPLPGTRTHVSCDTLLLSVGLIPENELSRQAGIEMHTITGGPEVNERGETSIPGIFASGNVLHVHDIVDKVSREAEIIAEGVAEHLTLEGAGAQSTKTRRAVEEKEKVELNIPVSWDEQIGYVLPSKISNIRDILFSLRVREPGSNRKIKISNGPRIIKKKGVPKVNPAEMIQIRISGEKLEGIDAIKVELE